MKRAIISAALILASLTACGPLPPRGGPLQAGFFDADVYGNRVLVPEWGDLPPGPVKADPSDMAERIPNGPCGADPTEATPDSPTALDDQAKGTINIAESYRVRAYLVSFRPPRLANVVAVSAPATEGGSVNCQFGAINPVLVHVVYSSNQGNGIQTDRGQPSPYDDRNATTPWLDTIYVPHKGLTQFKLDVLASYQITQHSELDNPVTLMCATYVNGKLVQTNAAIIDDSHTHSVRCNMTLTNGLGGIPDPEPVSAP